MDRLSLEKKFRRQTSQSYCNAMIWHVSRKENIVLRVLNFQVLEKVCVATEDDIQKTGGRYD